MGVSTHSMKNIMEAFLVLWELQSYGRFRPVIKFVLLQKQNTNMTFKLYLIFHGYVKLVFPIQIVVSYKRVYYIVWEIAC